MELVKSGYGCAVVTNPIAKSVFLKLTRPTGHTEYLAELDGRKNSNDAGYFNYGCSPDSTHTADAVPAALKAMIFFLH